MDRLGVPAEGAPSVAPAGNPHSLRGDFPGPGRPPQAGSMKASLLFAALLLVPAPATGQPASPPGSWSWPLSPRPAVLRVFDPPDRPWLSGHRGVDLQTAYDGAPVTSPAAGTVAFVGFVVDRPVVTIDHGNGLRSSFEPVESTLRPG